MSCIRHHQHVKPTSINKYQSTENILLLIGMRGAVTFPLSSPLPGSLMGCDNPLSRCVGGGWWRQSDEEALLQPSPSRYITLKINAASRRELLAVPGLRTAAPLPGVRVALWQLMQLLKPLRHWGGRLCMAGSSGAVIRGMSGMRAPTASSSSGAEQDLPNPKQALLVMSCEVFAAHLAQVSGSRLVYLCSCAGAGM